MRKFVIFVVLLCSIHVYAGFSAHWCTDKTGRFCNSYAVSTETTAVLAEDEEVVESYETTVLSNENCASSCDWISTMDYTCTSCVYPWAVYKGSQTSSGCITKSNAIHLMATNPAAVAKYAKQCETNGRCNCASPLNAWKMKIISHTKQFCRYGCAYIQPPVFPVGSSGIHRQWVGRLNEELKLSVEVMLSSRCPNMFEQNNVPHTSVEPAVTAYCKHIAIAKVFPKDSYLDPAIVAWRDSKKK